MPKRIQPEHHWNPNDTREELIDRSTTAELAVAGIALRLAPVPLFRQGSSGLEQAVRVHASGEGSADVTISSASKVLDRVTLDCTAGTATAHLFLPELGAPETFAVEALSGSESATVDLVVEPQRKYTVHLVHHSHFDYGYTDPQALVMEHQLRYIDAALDLITATDDWDDAATFRWNIEVTYPLSKWLGARPQAMREELMRRVKEGRIEINGLPFSMHSEVYSIDELAWGLKFTDELREQYGIEIVSAIQSDVPGATIGLLNLLTSADIRYFSVAHNYAGRSVPFRVGGQDLTRPFWWQGADGKRLLVWQSDTPHGVAYMDGVILGMSDSEPVARGLLPDYLTALGSRPYPYGKHAFGWHDFPAGLEITKKPYPHDLLYLRVQNGFADNAPPTMALSETVRDWNELWAWPKLRVSTNRDFFAEAEAKLGDKLDTFEGDWTDWWVDGVGSGALPLGLNRQTQATIRTAQTLHTLAVNRTGESAPQIAAEIDLVYEDAALFDEHTWGSANPWDDKLEKFESGALQWNRKSAFAYQAHDRANVLLNSGLHFFGSSLSASPDAITSLIVFNPSGWQRSDLARVFVPAERLPYGTAVSLVHAETGKVVPHRLTANGNEGFRAKGQWIEFAAHDLPSVGYARYDLVPVTDDHTDTGELNPFTLESPFYRVQIDPRDGFIASITDLQSGRELVDDDAPFGFNEYIYDRYTSASGFNHLSGRIEDVDLRLMGDRWTAKHASVVSRTRDAVADRLTIRLAAQGSGWLETTISLPIGIGRIDIVNRLLKTATMEKESVYFAFPFALDDADPEYEITGGVTSQDSPHVPGSARHMFAIRHWLGLQDAQGSAVWATAEAPLIELGEIALPYAPFPSTLPADRSKRSTIYSWALNNLWDTNFPPAQGGEMHFRYAIVSDATLDRRELGIRTGATFSAPLTGFCLQSGSGATPVTASYLSVGHPLVEVVSIAPSRHSAGMTAFLHSLADEKVETTVDFAGLNPVSIKIGNHLERHLQEIPLSGTAATLTIDPGALITVQITTSS